MPGFVPNWAGNIASLNVKDFGAVGNGSIDDTAAIQACFDAAFGSYTTNHFSPFNNKGVYFPAGNYSIRGPLYISQAQGGRVSGAGAFATQLFFQGSATQGNVMFASPNNTWTPVLCLNRVQNFEFSGMCLSCDLASTGISNQMIGVYLDQRPTDPGGTGICSVNSFKNMVFQNFHMGVLGGLYGANCENMQFYECNFEQCRFAGARPATQNTLNWAVYGGGSSNCGSAGAPGNPGATFSCLGSFQVISNISFSNGIHANITGVSSGTGGVVRLALNDAKTNLWATGYYVRVSRVTGTGAADVNGIWQLTTVDPNHIDLQGTTFNAGHTYSGGDVFAAYAYDVYAATNAISIIGGSSESQQSIYAGTSISIEGFVYRPGFPDTIWIYGNGGFVASNGCVYAVGNGGVTNPAPVIMDCQNNSIGIFTGLQGGGNADGALFKSFGPSGQITYNGTLRTGTGQIGNSAFVGFLGDVILNSPPMTISALPAASVAFKSTHLTVSDCNIAYTSANIGTDVSTHGGGANVVPVRCLNGTTWTIG